MLATALHAPTGAGAAPGRGGAAIAAIRAGTWEAGMAKFWLTLAITVVAVAMPAATQAEKVLRVDTDALRRPQQCARHP